MDDSQPETRARNTKGRSLGERPAFLRSPPAYGVVEALGCVGRGFDEAAWGPLAGFVELWWVRARSGGERCQTGMKYLSDMNYVVGR